MKKKLLFIVAALAAGSTAFAQLQNTGWRRPSDTHFPNDWTTPQNGSGSDDLYAVVLHQSGCRCPFMDLSGDTGITFSSYNLFGPYGITDSYQTKGDSMDNWGHPWTEAELSDSNFLLRIWNSSTLLKQGYTKFGFGIPPGSSITGIAVRVEMHGDSNYTYDMVDNIEAMVFYSLPTAVNEVYNTHPVLTVYPVPARDIIHLRFNDDADGQKIQLIDIRGELVAEKMFSNILAGNDYTMDVSKIAPGIYFLNIISGQKTVNAKILIR